MNSFWTSVTHPQAVIIAGFFTVLAAIVGVWLGSWVFGGKVKDLKGAIDDAEKKLKGHLDEFEFATKAKFDSIRSGQETLEEEVSANTEVMSRVQASVAEIESAADNSEGSASLKDLRETLRQNWQSVRDRLEEIASDPNIDGRVRAKYARIDRRRYAVLVDSLASDGRLKGQKNIYLEAINLWMKYKGRQREPLEADITRMREISASVTS